MITVSDTQTFENDRGGEFMVELLVEVDMRFAIARSCWRSLCGSVHS
jgi:hypothetical protein